MGERAAVTIDGSRGPDLLRLGRRRGVFPRLFVVFGLSYSFGVFFERMLAKFGRSRGATSLGLAGLASPYLAGAGHDAIGSYTPAFVAGGLAALVGAGAVVATGRLWE